MRSLLVLLHSSKVDKDQAQTHHFNAVSQQDQHDPDTSGKQISYYSALSLLRGKVYDALENHGRAVKWYQAALKADPFCYEAFQVTQLDNNFALGTINFVMQLLWVFAMESAATTLTAFSCRANI